MLSVMSVTTQRSTHELIKETVMAHQDSYRLCGQFVNIVDALAIAIEMKPDVIILRDQMLFISLEDFMRSLAVKGIFCAYIILDSDPKNSASGKVEQRGQIIARVSETGLTSSRVSELLEQVLPLLLHSLSAESSRWTPYEEDTGELASWLKENQFFGAVINHQISLSENEQPPSFLRCTQGFLIMLEIRLHDSHSSFSLWQNMQLLKKMIAASQILLCDSKGYHFFALNDRKLCFWINSAGDLNDLLKVAAQLRDNLYSLFENPEVIGMTACCSEQPISLDHLAQEYRAVDGLCKYHFFVDDHVILYSGWLTEHTITSSNENIQYCFHQLSESFHKFNRKMYCTYIDYLFSLIEQSLSFQTYFYVCNQLILWYCSLCEHFGLSCENSIVDANQSNFMNLADAKATFYRQLMILFEDASLHALPAQNTYITQALSFCDSHVLEEFDLTDVASAVGLSPSYLSHLFQKELGKSFVEIRTARKIAQAKILLEKHKVYETAQMLDFQDVKYFSRVFRKVTGMTPSEYQRSFKETGVQNGKSGKDTK